MNEKVVYLKLDGYTRDWLINRFGDPVRFPARSYENEILARYIVSLRHICGPKVEKEGKIAIVVPAIHGKPWESHNHFTRDGKKCLKAAVKNLFELDLLGSVMPRLAEGDIYKFINDFCRSRGISHESRPAVIKRFYRIRREYQKNGINLIVKK